MVGWAGGPGARLGAGVGEVLVRDLGGGGVDPEAQPQRIMRLVEVLGALVFRLLAGGVAGEQYTRGCSVKPSRPCCRAMSPAPGASESAADADNGVGWWCGAAGGVFEHPHISSTFVQLVSPVTARARVTV